MHMHIINLKHTENFGEHTKKNIRNHKKKEIFKTYSSIRLSALVSDRDRVWRLWARLPG